MSGAFIQLSMTCLLLLLLNQLFNIRNMGFHSVILKDLDIVGDSQLLDSASAFISGSENGL